MHSFPQGPCKLLQDRKQALFRRYVKFFSLGIGLSLPACLHEQTSFFDCRALLFGLGPSLRWGFSSQLFRHALVFVWHIWKQNLCIRWGGWVGLGLGRMVEGVAWGGSSDWNQNTWLVGVTPGFFCRSGECEEGSCYKKKQRSNLWRKVEQLYPDRNLN